jgi:CRP-like cAMP-binding protein
MEAISSRARPTRPSPPHVAGRTGGGWVARLVEVLQPLSIRADRLASMELFAGLRWSELEFAAGLMQETAVDRGTRMSVQGRPNSRLYLITEGEALVSADARPLRVASGGDPIGIAGMLYGTNSPETTIALTPIRALVAEPAQFQELTRHRSIRVRMTLAAGDQLRARRHRR